MSNNKVGRPTILTKKDGTPLAGMTLSDPLQDEANQVQAYKDKMQGQRHVLVIMTCMAAAARLQALELRKNPAPGDLIWKPLADDDSREYHMLKTWWDHWPKEKQVRLSLTMKQLAEGVYALAREY